MKLEKVENLMAYIKNKNTLIMYKKNLLISYVFISLTCFAQVSVSTNESLAHPNAMLEIKDNNKGLLLPRGDANCRKFVLQNNTPPRFLAHETKCIQ